MYRIACLQDLIFGMAPKKDDGLDSRIPGVEKVKTMPSISPLAIPA